MNSISPTFESSHWQRGVDRFGASASFLCAVHCATLPFLAATLPLIGLGFLASRSFEVAFVLLAGLVASIALASGWREHRKPWPLRLFIAGMTLLAVGVFSEAHEVPWLHFLLVVSGGLVLSAAHVSNLRATTTARA